MFICFYVYISLTQSGNMFDREQERQQEFQRQQEEEENEELKRRQEEAFRKQQQLGVMFHNTYYIVLYFIHTFVATSHESNHFYVCIQSVSLCHHCVCVCVWVLFFWGRGSNKTLLLPECKWCKHWKAFLSNHNISLGEIGYSRHKV